MSVPPMKPFKMSLMSRPPPFMMFSTDVEKILRKLEEGEKRASLTEQDFYDYVSTNIDTIYSDICTYHRYIYNGSKEGLIPKVSELCWKCYQDKRAKEGYPPIKTDAEIAVAKAIRKAKKFTLRIEVCKIYLEQDRRKLDYLRKVALSNDLREWTHDTLNDSITRCVDNIERLQTELDHANERLLEAQKIVSENTG